MNVEQLRLLVRWYRREGDVATTDRMASVYPRQLDYPLDQQPGWLQLDDHDRFIRDAR